MCGIYGRIGRRDDPLDQRATLALAHRGPDDRGLLIDPHGPTDRSIALGHTRLSILDLSAAGHQPMRSADDQVAIAYNGEIYNFQALRADLEKRGHAFHSNSDTEVLLHLYQEYGDGLLDRIEGMYAFGLWDRQRQRMLLARDPSGIKPLFYRTLDAPHGTGDTLVFASEIKALLVDPRFERRENLRSLAGYLTYLYVPPPGTAFEGISRLDPGHKLVVEGTRVSIERFHRFETLPKADFSTVDEAADRLDVLLREVIEQHMISDVPLGAFLSGGIDSGLMVAMMTRIQRERGDPAPTRTFTIGFGSEGRIYDEATPAARIAEHFGTDHQTLRVDPDLATGRFQNIAQQFDEPFGIATALLHDALCEKTRREVTVALAGDGGDEGFGGYPRHRAARSLALYTALLPDRVRTDWIPRAAANLPDRAEGRQALRRIRRFLTSSGQDFATVYREWLNHYSRGELQALLTPNALAAAGANAQNQLGDLGAIESLMREEATGNDPMDAAFLADIYGFLANNVLRDSDRMSMRVGLEVRVPYADRRVLDFGLRLPTRLKVSSPLAALVPGGRSTSKATLRALGARYLPDWCSSAPKQGFVPPMGTWLNGSLRELLLEATEPGRLRQRGIVRPEVVQEMISEHRAGRRDRTWHLWGLVVLESWFQQRIDQLELPAVDLSALPPEIWADPRE